VSLLHSRALHFARSDCFDDPFEGTAPELTRAYIDFETVNPGGFFDGITPFVFKRRSFEHERELRAVIWMDDAGATHAGGEETTLVVPKDRVRAVQVDLDQIVEAIVVSPAAPGWFGDLVEVVTREAGLPQPVRRSTLYTPPSRRSSSHPDPGVRSFSITRDVIEHLHQQHLQYTEVQLRERERLGQRQSEAISERLASMERDIAGLRAQSEEGELRDGDVLAEQERDLRLRRLVFLYAESLAKPQIALLGKLQRDVSSAEALSEDKQQLIRLVVAQASSLMEVVNARSI
jgi:hypothetical protein